MDTPIIAQYYRETEPKKRKQLLDQAIASGEDQEANEIRREIYEARYKNTTNDGGIAAGHKIFGPGKAQKEILKELDDVKFREIRAKSPLHEELLYRECKHLVKFYMTLCAQDKNYNSILCGLITIKKESSEAKMKRDIYETAIRLPKDLNLEEELALVTKAAHEVYGQEYPEESGFPE